MNSDSYVNLLQLVNMCILNLSDKTKWRKTEKKISSWAVSISVLEYLCAFVFYFVHWLLSMNYCTNWCSECFSFTHLISRQKKKEKIIFFEAEKMVA